MLEFSLVIPCRNEEEFIEEIVVEVDRYLSKEFRDYRIIILDASSKDRTPDIARRLARKNKHIEAVLGRPPYGKGADVRYGLLLHDAALYGFIDADLVPCVKYLPTAIRRLRRGSDVVLGSRYLEPGMVERPKFRLYISRFYNLLISALFGAGISDYQCGFKFFSNRAVRLIRKYSIVNSGAFDSEVLLMAHFAGMRMEQLPIEWKERRRLNAVRDVRKTVADMLLFTPFIFSSLFKYRVMRFRPK